jgi:hypothetical protein
MTRTFLVALDTGSETDLFAIAQDIMDELDGAFSVSSVKPWSGKETGALPTLIPPTPQGGAGLPPLA